MAVYTKLTRDQVSALSARYALGPCQELIEVAKGSVNTNYLVTFEKGARFLRVYEDQETTGVAYEWALLSHLVSHGLETPLPDLAHGPGVVRLAGKPTALFPVVPGDESCQPNVSEARAATVGRYLARVHLAVADFGWRRPARFGFDRVRERLVQIRASGKRELLAAADAAERGLDAAEDLPPLPTGAIHGDLFRDNVRFEGDVIAGALDWESAADGAFAYDLAITALAWTFGSALDPALLRAMVRGYEAVRPLGEDETRSFSALARAAAARFTITRITDFELRAATGPRVEKDYRRFLMRLETVTELGDAFIRLARE